MDFALGAVGAIIIFVIVSILIGALFLYLGAAIAGIENKSFGKAIGAFLVSMIVVTILSGILSLIPVIGTIIGFIIGIIISVLIIKAIFSTSSGKAFVALLMSWVLYIIAIFLLSLVFATFFASLLESVPMSF